MIYIDTIVNNDMRTMNICPNYRKFGDEELCINGNDIIDIDISGTIPDIVSCPLKIHLDVKNNTIYCNAIQDNLKHINGKLINATEIYKALLFLGYTNNINIEDKDRRIGLSTCVHKYLTTIKFMNITSWMEMLMEKINNNDDSYENIFNSIGCPNV